MTSEIRTNRLTSRAGLSTVTLSDSGPVVTGIATFGTSINIGVTTIHSNLSELHHVVSTGVITATKFVGDISDATGASAGLGTALSQDQSNPLNKLFYTDRVLSIGSTITVDHPASATGAYTQYADIQVEDNADLIVADGDDLIPDILGLGGNGTTGAGGAGRLLVDNIVNRSATGAPSFPNGIDAPSNLILKTGGSERLRIGSSGQIGLGGANYGTSGQFLKSTGSGSAVQWATPVVAGSILQTVYGSTTQEIVVTSTSFQNFTALNTSITRMSSNSHLWVWINAVRLLIQADSNEARVRITDGTSATTPYRLVNYDSDGNYLSFNPCLNWYWTKSHVAGTTVTITPQIRGIQTNNIVWGDNGDTSMMIIQEIAR